MGQKREDLEQELINLRRDFHQYPEVSFQETRTAEKIANYIKALGLEIQTGVGGTGVIAFCHGRGSGKTVALRADMDALSIGEIGGKSFCSQNNGIMHACGHDGHMAIVLGAAKLLQEKSQDFCGTVKFIFQPAEEKAQGAKIMVDQGVLEGVDTIFGLHLIPEIASGKIGLKSGPAMAASDLIEIIIRGKGGHGAEPHQGINAIVVAAQVILALQTIASQQIDPLAGMVLNIGMIEGGYRYNIIPDQVRIVGTVRTLSEETRDEVEMRIERIIHGITESVGAEYSYRYERGCPVLVNHPDSTEFVAQVCRETLGEDRLEWHDKPFLLGEDFAYYLRKIEGAYFWLGIRNEEKGCIHPLHHPSFNLDEDVLIIGAEFLSNLALRYLNK